MNRKLPPTDEVIKQYQQGLSMTAIAKKYGATSAAVSSCFKLVGFVPRSLSESFELAYKTGRRKVTVKTGSDHYMWKGGKDKRDYRKVIKKELCAHCGATENLGIHHVDLDHYNDAEENLLVLCVSCHMSLHKQAYWDAYHAGKETPKSNGRVGWKHE